MKKGIGFKIITMAVVISAVAALIGGIGLYTTNRVSKLAVDMYQKSVLRIQYANTIYEDILMARSILLEANTPGRTEEQAKASEKQFQEGFKSFSDAIAKYESTNITAADKKELIQTVKDAGNEYVDKGSQMFTYILKNDFTGADKYMGSVIAPIRTGKLEPAVDKLVKMQITDAETSYTQSMQITKLSITIIVLAILIGLAVSLTLGFTITRSITKPVTRVVNSLSDSSSQISISSTQLSSASQEIANGAQEQASSIEETTSSMEELSSMVRQNLGNTRQASLLSEKATEASQNGADKMADMLTAMNNISKSTEDIRNVIDVIDDIAFQTNMLALNAAVEAARAGEAGMGFAVVADEVKNLANRSSESAKETASMIKETLKNVEDGMTISKNLSEIFKDILSNSKKVMDMNKEVETASGQQDEGISQVNKAMIQFDTVVQTNASSAEETAGAAEELQGQVTSLNEIVDTLYEIVSGREYTEGSTGQEGRPVHGAAPAKAHRQEASLKDDSAGRHAPAATRRQPGDESGSREKAAGSREKAAAGGQTAAKKETPEAGGAAGKAEEGGVHKGAGHAISFEDDEDFKPAQ
jgi:methyl-accepting chemotaxis protein